MDSNEKNSLENNPYKKSVGPLSTGLLALYEPSLLKVQASLKELNEKESKLVDQIHEENVKLSQVQHASHLQEMFHKIEFYQSKLRTIKSDMKMIHDKSTKLKKRVGKVQQLKEKQDQIKLQKEIEIKKEEDLIAKH